MTFIDCYDVSLEEAAEIIAELVPLNAVTKQQQALQLYVRGCERQAERRAIEASARVAELHKHTEPETVRMVAYRSDIAAAIRSLTIPVDVDRSKAPAGGGRS